MTKYLCFQYGIIRLWQSPDWIKCMKFFLDLFSFQIFILHCLWCYFGSRQKYSFVRLCRQSASCDNNCSCFLL